jgi:hypothetical protein
MTGRRAVSANAEGSTKNVMRRKAVAMRARSSSFGSAVVASRDSSGKETAATDTPNRLTGSTWTSWA